MNKRVLHNLLQLSYSPLSNHDFIFLKDDSDLQLCLRNSCIYIIAQRPVIYFQYKGQDEESGDICINIRQEGKDKYLSCKLPLFQNGLATDRGKHIYAVFSSHDRITEEKQVVEKAHVLKIFQADEDFQNRELVAWLSPEMLLYKFSRGTLEAKVDGEIRQFMKYKVHYVGKSTEQDIWKRLIGHSTLQEIISIEKSINDGSLPTHETVILFLEFYDTLSYNSYSSEVSSQTISNDLFGCNMPKRKTIFSDAEKALIKAIQPEYNKVVYKRYPLSKDGLSKYNFNSYSYTLKDDITLQYEEGEINGRNSFYEGDKIVIEQGKSLKIIKYDR